MRNCLRVRIKGNCSEKLISALKIASEVIPELCFFFSDINTEYEVTVGNEEPLKGASGVFDIPRKTAYVVDLDGRYRLSRAILHEIGHMLGLNHCSNRNCVMSELSCLDDSYPEFCHVCRAALREGIARST
ncbi:MAG: hypothetical protein DSO07_08135 [Thermoproteota archaeon]|jgi:predicted Zn-dependent protease|uniref:Matrixin family metalloprotease n=1 Tax=Candidatus Methanodesulfokora washburnensis TaxID=2478471 RepID=A0A3R9PCH7_9CREN|nr:matrixin family metalloprotease [Candidatus Methanodesulfokores washburnensis]RSN72580.1 hypothetical protein D6D85_13205 [Candidatus Methanodesulfokores washburnensis]RZN62760.1 MAG: matrixin family metalloprotease [Candidatus Methanodesulfokores washburnensis]TDA40744.1 MAG: hypothetical protein DSO07_08135 [Candidatus Korarchaeota archaeon]